MRESKIKFALKNGHHKKASLPLKALILNYSDLSKSQTILLRLFPSLSLVFLWVTSCHQGDGCHCHHGDGLHRASQLLSGTINKHQKAG